MTISTKFFAVASEEKIVRLLMPIARRKCVEIAAKGNSCAVFVEVGGRVESLSILAQAGIKTVC